ncbi:BadF/BadG/BcrA/BcrD ATPase family protein [Gymnodinialimonas ulvae]|uniref:BadF/BadG/BcrA/BcrD ATPase family protein n=1 Tax=Gymnodinialimonas ulvae TaxID=3126504 RepID=UPI0030991108
MTDRIDIGIDGGGSGCRVVVSTQGRAARATGGPANVVTDPAAAEAAIRAALLGALGQMSLSLDNMQSARVVAGLAGCRLPGTADAFAMRLPFLANVVDDSVTALEGAFDGDQGTLVNLGTGSFFIRRDARGITHHGGWGVQIGDEGSAAWLGREALRQLMWIEDGRAPHWSHDPLRQQIWRALDAHPVEFAANATPEAFGQLAPLVVASDGDWAHSLRSKVLREVVIAFEDIGHPDGAPWVMTGGLGAALVERTPDALPPGSRPAAGTALDGALAMARALP